MKDNKAMSQDELDAQAFEREVAYHESKKAYDKLGYNSIQEFSIDLVTIGEYNKTQETWKEVDEVGSIRTDRVYISKAQARFYGVKVVDGDAVDDA